MNYREGGNRIFVTPLYIFRMIRTTFSVIRMNKCGTLYDIVKGSKNPQMQILSHGNEIGVYTMEISFMDLNLHLS